MTLAELYATSAAVPLGEPEMVDTFYPLDHPVEKTILIHSFAGGIKEENGQRIATFPAKVYDHFGEVISLLKPIVEPLGYKLVQIGGPGEPILAGIESLVGKTTLHQCAYLVRRCALLIGNDSQWAHVRGAANKPLVTLYGSTSHPHFPHWRDHGQTSLIESHRGGGKPSYASHENPKTINWIPPEQVTDSALFLLGIPGGAKRQSLFFGPEYTLPVIELVPNVIVDPRLQLPGPLAIRMDYHHDETVLAQNLQYRKATVLLDKAMDLALLQRFKPNVQSLRIEVDKIDPLWLKAVRKLGIPTGFFSAEPDLDKLAKLRLDLYDALHPGGIDRFVPATKDDFLKGAKTYLNKELDNGLKIDTLSFKTHKALLSADKVYLSKAHWLAGKNTPSTDHNSGTVIDSPDFWVDLNAFYLYHE